MTEQEVKKNQKVITEEFLIIVFLEFMPHSACLITSRTGEENKQTKKRQQGERKTTELIMPELKFY